jgi:ATP-binding cassette subfamily G (WHITE) protein 2 (SNQ2)
MAFIGMLLFFTEFNTSSVTDTPVVLFKRGSKKAAALVNVGPPDEEKAGTTGDIWAAVDHTEVKLALPVGTPAAPRMTDIFSWQNLNYVVPVKDGTRKLLDNVSGYVVPGKLTALMYVFETAILSCGCDTHVYVGVNLGLGRRRY